MEAYDPATDTMLCPSLFSKQRYLSQKSIMNTQIFYANYHQKSVEKTGALFPEESLKRFSLKTFIANQQEYKKDKGYSEYKLGYWDIADDGTDSLSAPIGNIHQGKVFITDIIHTDENVGVTFPLTVALLKKENPDYIRVEANNQGSIFIKWLREKVTTRIMPVTSHTKKETRIQMSEAFVKNYFYFVEEDEIVPNSHYARFMEELTSYMKDGSSKHDDAADAISGLAKLVQAMCKKEFPIIIPS